MKKIALLFALLLTFLPAEAQTVRRLCPMPISRLALPHDKRVALAEDFGHLLEKMSLVAVDCVAKPDAEYDAQVWFEADDGSPISPETKRHWAISVVPRNEVEAIYKDNDKRTLSEALQRMADAVGKP